MIADREPRSRGGRARVAGAAAVTLLALLLSGCTTPPRKPTPSGPRTSRAADDRTTSQDPARIAADISRLVAERTRRKEPVNTVLVANVAVIGLGRPARTDREAMPPATPGRTPPPSTVTPPGMVPRPGAPGGTTPPATTPPGPALGTYTPPRGSVGVLDRDVVARIRERYPFLKRVFSTNDPVLVTRIAALARDLRNGTPIDRRIDELASVVRALSTPQAPTPAAPSPRS